MVAEFTRTPDRNLKCQLALARFLALCCFEGTPLHGRTLTPDTVADRFPNTHEGKLGLAHFRSECWLKNLCIGGAQISIESVIADFAKLNASLSLARFKSDCYMLNLPVNGRQITSQEVMDGFPDTPPGRLYLARFKARCCFDNQHLNHKNITPEEVLASLQADGTALDLANFRVECFSRGIALNGQQMTPERLCDECQRASAHLELARLKAHCCLKSICINGQPVLVREVLESFPATSGGRLGRARFRADCCRVGLRLDDRPVTPVSVVREFDAIRDRRGLAYFRQWCCLRGIAIADVPISPESVLESFQALGAALEVARFKEACCLNGIPVNGQAITTENVIDSFLAINAHLELARFRALCFNNNLLVKGRTFTAREVADSFPANRQGKLGRAHFMATCFVEGKSIGDKPVCPQSVVRDFQSFGAKLDLARFVESCCLSNLAIDGRTVTPDEVADSYQALGAQAELAYFRNACQQRSLCLDGQSVSLESVADNYQLAGATVSLMHFRAMCCLSGQKLYGEYITPESVIAGFRGRENEQINIADFKAKCCLQGLPIDGLAVAAEEVIDQFPDSHVGKLGLTGFKERCCLRGLYVHGEPITPEMVLQSAGQHTQNHVCVARFMQECCRHGLHLHGKLVSPRMVLDKFPSTVEGQLGIAHLLHMCCHRGLLLDGYPVTPEMVVKRFPANYDGKLGKCHFLEYCCLNGIPLNGEPVTTGAVLSALRDTGHKTSIAAFLIECFLHNLHVNGQQLCASAIQAEFPNNRAGREKMAYFNKQCCLNGIQLAGKLVTPEQVTRIYDEENWLLDKAIFYAQLALRARTINGSHLDNAGVLEAFSQAPGDNTIRKVEFLIQRLIALPEDCDGVMPTFNMAWQIVTSVWVDDESHSYQLCVLQFLAMRHALTVQQKPVSPDQVWKSIKALRNSFANTRLRFHFLAHCCRSDLQLEGRPVTTKQVLDCLGTLPASKHRHALTRWFTEIRHRQPADALGHLLMSPGSRPTDPATTGKRPKRIDVFIDNLHSPGPFPCHVTEYFPEVPSLPLSAQTQKILSIVQTIKHLRITGSFARCLQGIGSSFNDIDLLGTGEAINTLISRLSSQLVNYGLDTEIPCLVSTLSLPGCPLLRLPTAFSITLAEGDFGHQRLILQANVLPPEALGALDVIELPVGDAVLNCLPFHAEVQLITETVTYLEDNLDALITGLQNDNSLNIPRTILFNYPQHPQERIFGLIMRCLLTLNKARQFCHLTDTSNRNNPTTLRELRSVSHRLLVKLQQHSQHEPFITAVRQKLSVSQPLTTYQTDRRVFVHNLLALLMNPAKLF